MNSCRIQRNCEDQWCESWSSSSLPNHPCPFHSTSRLRSAHKIWSSLNRHRKSYGSSRTSVRFFMNWFPMTTVGKVRYARPSLSTIMRTQGFGKIYWQMRQHFTHLALWIVTTAKIRRPRWKRSFKYISPHSHSLSLHNKEKIEKA